MKQIQINSIFDDTILYCNIYEVENPIAIVQIVHGMMEYQERYLEFAKFLNNYGFSVITSDIRGHGKNCLPKNLGYMGEIKQDKALVLDQISITNYIKETYKDIDIYLFGHSMGTMISRNIIQNYDNLYKKVLLTGAPAPQGIASLGLLVAKTIKLFKGSYHKSKLLQELSTGSFSKAVPNYKTKNDWLSYNEENVEKYNNDSLCGFPFTTSGYIGLFKILVNLGKPRLYKVYNKELPILLLSGKDDPCTLGTKGIIKSIKVLQKAGYIYINAKTYDNMRHEILNEKNKDEVYNDILKFFRS